MSDITVILAPKYNLEWKHEIEKRLDEAFVHLGFSRTGSGVNEDGTTEIYFRQFGVCGEVKGE